MRPMIVWLRPLALALSLVALLMLALSGPGVRFDLWSYRTGITVFRWTAYAAIAAALVSAIALAIPRVRAHGVLLPHGGQALANFCIEIRREKCREIGDGHYARTCTG